MPGQIDKERETLAEQSWGPLVVGAPLIDGEHQMAGAPSRTLCAAPPVDEPEETRGRLGGPALG
jgi:hypothetical protein